MKTTWKNWTCLVGTALCLLAPAVMRGQDTEPVNVEPVALRAVEQTNSEAAYDQAFNRPEGDHKRLGAVVAIGKGAELKAGESAEAVVAVGGSAKSAGHVSDSVVAVFGDAEVNGPVRDSVVAVLGNVRLGSNAVVGGDVVSVGGKVETAEGAKVRGQVQPVEFGIPGLPSFDGLKLWIQECVFKMRPLSLQVRWVWVVTGVMVLLYFLVSIAFPKPVRVCADELTNRPATTFFVGLLMKVMVPLLTLVLIATGVGLFVIPFLFAAVFFGLLVGKAAVLQYFGTVLGRPFGLDGKNQSLLAFALGTLLMIGLYLVPVVGLLTYTILGMWGIGAAVTGVLGGMSREKQNTQPPRGAPGTFPPVPPIHGNPGTSAAAGPQTAEPPVWNVSPNAAYPKAGFWERMCAAFLDLALLLIPFVILGPLGLLVALAYFAGMWAWRGTTIGGIVLNHRVVRQDGSALTFPVALVRGLAAAFSAVFLFLGFFWIGWNPEKQGWHDKIAGTYVLRLPRSMPLVCL